MGLDPRNFDRTGRYEPTHNTGLKPNRSNDGGERWITDVALGSAAAVSALPVPVVRFAASAQQDEQLTQPRPRL